MKTIDDIIESFNHTAICNSEKLYDREKVINIIRAFIGQAFDDKQEALKEPILVTEDGVEIMNPELALFGVNKITFGVIELFAERAKDSPCIFFSTPEARTNYIILNKPLLSIKNVIGVLNQNMFFSQSDRIKVEQALTSLAKSKYESC